MSEQSRIFVCPHCLTLNRVASGKEALAKCGKCGTKVFEPRSVELVGSTIDRHIVKNGAPVLVDFYSPGCGPCLMMAPHFEDAARQLYPHVRLMKIDTSVELAVANRFGIQASPTLAIFRGGREIVRQPGAMSGPDIVAWTRRFV